MPASLTRYMREVLRDRPVGYWPLNETAGTNAANLGTVGSASDGTYSNVTLAALPLAGGRVPYFNGSNAQVSFPHASAFNVSTSFTFEMWVGSASTSQTNKYVLQRATNEGAIIYGYVSKTFEFYSAPGNYTGTDPRTGTGIQVDDTRLHHLAYVYHGSTWAAYLDGRLRFHTARTFSLGAESNPIYLGSSGGADWFNGWAGHFALYDRPLPATRIQAHHRAGLYPFRLASPRAAA